MRLVASDGAKIDPRDLRAALGRFSTGVTVVTTRSPGGASIGLTANSFAAVSLDPPLVLWSLRMGAVSLPIFMEAGRFTINVLAYEQERLCGHFATPAEDKFLGIEHDLGEVGCPVLKDSLAVFECEAERAFEAGDHIVFIGRVKTASYRDGEPLVFASGRLTTLSQPTSLSHAAA